MLQHVAVVLLLSTSSLLRGRAEKLFFDDEDYPKVVELQLGESFVLNCEAGGSPNPTIHWLRNGDRIIQGGADTILDDSSSYESHADKQPMLQTSSTRSRLFIDCFTDDDVATYTCVAETPKRRITRNTKIQLDKSAFPGVNFQSNEQCVNKRQKRGIASRVYMWTANRVEFEGANVQLFCRAAGEPRSTVTWYDRDDHLISDQNSGYEILPNGDLLIRKVKWMSHMGLYRCVANNELGKDEIGVFLYPTTP